MGNRANDESSGSDLDSFLSGTKENLQFDVLSGEMRRISSKSKEVPLIVRFKRLEQLMAKKKQMNKSKARLPTDRIMELFGKQQTWLPRASQIKPADGEVKQLVVADRSNKKAD